jgi:hypothetical protein
MTGSSPQDLAVAFRSFPRRLSDALDSAEDDAHRAAAAPLATQLDGVARRAAGLLHLPASGDLATVASAVAAEIDRRPPEGWDDPTLDELRSLALDGGQLLRQIEAAASS